VTSLHPASVSEQTQSAIGILADLVAFDTTSRESNLALIDYACAYLSRLGIQAVKIMSADRNKSNLLATLGPQVDGGVILSGHTDVVPVDGQIWQSDPFRLFDNGATLVGRGVADMKTFLAAALAAAPVFAMPKYLKRPVHLAFSYDEEVGCLGAPGIIQEMVASGWRPSAVIVGEPTEMKVVGTHKGVTSYEVLVTGHEAHSSLPHLPAIQRLPSARSRVAPRSIFCRVAAPSASTFAVCPASIPPRSLRRFSPKSVAMTRN